MGVEIKALPNVKGCVFISKDSAWEKQMESLGEDAALLEGLGENPLPDAYKVTVDDLSRFEETVASLKNLPGVLSIQENSELGRKGDGDAASLLQPLPGLSLACCCWYPCLSCPTLSG